MTVSIQATHSFEKFTIDAGFEAGPGVTALFGHSGSGKTTLTNVLTGLFRPTQGHVSLNGAVLFDSRAGRFVPPHKRRVGVVFQDGRLFPHLSVAGNLDFGARYAPPGAARPDRDHIIEMLGLRAFLTRRPAGLSGGEKQRVALARALLSCPQILVMDEPLAALDEPRKDEVLPYLERLRDSDGIPIIYVSHSVGEIARLADRMVVLRAGKVACAGAVADVLSDPEMVPFVGVREAGSVLSARILRHGEDGLSELAIDGGALVIPGVTGTVGSTLRIRVLAQDIIVSLERPVGLSSRNVLPVVVEGLRKGDGPGVALSLRSGRDRLLARITARAAEELGLRPGLACYAILKATAVPRGHIGTGAE